MVSRIHRDPITKMQTRKLSLHGAAWGTLKMTKLQANHGKRLAIEVGRRTYARIPVGTHVISKDDDIVEVVLKYAGPALREGDIMVVSEKIVAITQERAYPISQIKPSWLARLPGKYWQKQV